MPLKIDLEAGLRPSPPPLPESGTPDNRFVFQRKIGQGAEGTVYVAVPTRNTDGSSSDLARQNREAVAVKVVTGHAFERCRATRHLWPSLVHPNVVYPRSSYFDDASGRCFLEMELLSSDLLEDIVSKGTLEDTRASEVAGFLASALDHLHRQGVAHCDVKLENVFVGDETVKLGDLGGIAHIRHSSVTTVPTADQDFGDSSPAVASSAAATVAGPSSAATAQKAPESFGSIIYAPPEFVRGGRLGSGRGTKRRNLLAGDMWSLGVTLYSAVAGRHPWEVANETKSKKFRRFRQKGAAAIMPKSFSPGLKSLLTRLLAIDPKQRPTAAQVLGDSWVTAPPASTPSPLSSTMGVALAAVGPSPVTPAGTETPSTYDDAERGIFPVKVVPVDASSIPATKPLGHRPIATVNRTARVVTAAEVESSAKVAYTGCRKRKEPETEDGLFPVKAVPVDASPVPATKPGGHRPIAIVNRTARVVTAAEAESSAEVAYTGCRKRKDPEIEDGYGPLLEDDAEACCSQMSSRGGFIDGGSGGGTAPPLKRARVVAPSPLTLSGVTVAPTEAHASLATTAKSWKETATCLRKEIRPAEDPLPSSEALLSAPGERGTSRATSRGRGGGREEDKEGGQNSQAFDA